ncbi:MAG: helix-turn-helix transcriptional regulator [Propionicimonas sp.]
MGRGLAAERVRRDVEVLARAGLDLPTFVDEALTSLRRAVPFDAVCFGSLDPSTGLLTGTLKFGSLRGVDAHDHEWGLIEYGTEEPTSFIHLMAQRLPAAGVGAGTAGVERRSARVQEFMRPYFGFTDELRAICLDEQGRPWAGIAFFRQDDEPDFDPDEIAYLGSLSSSLALGVRGGLLTSLAAVGPSPLQGPIVLIVDSTNQIARSSFGADERLAELASGLHDDDVRGLVGSLVGAARRYARGETRVAPRARIRTANGLWLVMHASPLSGGQAGIGDVAVTIEEARPPEIVPLVVATFGLTPREQDITRLVLQGLDTKEIAGQLFLSAYTVQDHLKSVFEKAGVRSRRELIARVYFDQYVPRMNESLGPSGWFLEPARAG